jgi:Protein of unknown function (DUF993)
MSLTLSLPAEGGGPTRYTMRGTPVHLPPGPHKHSRLAFSAAHVVADSFSDTEPSGNAAIDWDKTIAFRRRLLDLGLGIAEAMDTAQRGFGLDWNAALELITRSLEAATPEERDRIFSGVGTDHLSPEDAHKLDDVVGAYGEQIEAVQRVGGRIILMASRALSRVATNADDYRYVYNKAIAMADKPVILHWLGEMFDPELKGYWGAQEFKETLETALAVIHDNEVKIDGIKISLLDAQKEVDMRRRLPSGVKMYTGDDFNYPELIKGDAQGYSHALLGIFDPIAMAASAALTALARGDTVEYDRLMTPTVPLGRLIFRAPTQFYKTGVVFLAYLNGHQDHFVMLGGAQSMRPLPYFVDVFRLADAADLLENPDQALARMKSFLTMYGFEQ